MREDVEEKITGAQKGTLVHLCMQKLNEKVEYDLNKVKDLIAELQQKQIITEKEAEAINPSKILEFTKSDIWKQVSKAKEVYKERPFYINIPAKEIYAEEVNGNTKERLNEELGELEKESKEGLNEELEKVEKELKEGLEEEILVQGIIDLYYIDENDNLILLDYKTDYVEDEKELIEKYSKQLEFYTRALEEATGKKVYKRYIYSTYLGKEILL